MASSSGSVFYVAESSIFLTNVTFETSIVIHEDSYNRAMQLDEGSTPFGDGCVFTGWLGDTVIRNTNPDNGSLVLNSCDFRGNLASMMVGSPHSDAEIRNALVDETTLVNAAVEDGSVELVDRALSCSAAGACGNEGGCVDSVLGVLCVCIDYDTPCLIDGGTLALGVTTKPKNVIFNPNPVQFELTVSAKEDGITLAIWNLSYRADDLELKVVPESGVLPTGESLTIVVTGTPVGNDVGGNLTCNFTLISVRKASPIDGSSDGIVVQTIEVWSTFYLCQAFQYAVPADEDDSTESIGCEQCADIRDTQGVDCSKPGATQASLPIKAGYWRASSTSLTVHSCLHSEACKGATVMASSEDYCADGYQGPREYRYHCEKGVTWSELSSPRSYIGKRDVCVRSSSVYCVNLYFYFLLFHKSPEACPWVRYSRWYFSHHLYSLVPLQSTYFAGHGRLKTPHLVVAAYSRFCRLHCILKQNRSVCAVCTTSFGRGAGYSCHSCRSTLSAVLITVGSLFILLILLLFVLTTVFLVGGLDAVGNIHRSMASKLSIFTSAISSSRPVLSASEAAAFHEGARDASFTAAFDADSEPSLGTPNPDACVGIGRTTPADVTFANPKSAGSTDGYFIGTGLTNLERSDTANKVWTEIRSGKETTVCKGKIDLIGPTAAAAEAGAGAETGAIGSRGRCCGIGQRIKRLWSRLPLDKLKILVVVWQILTVFPSIAAVNFPPVYSQFMSWIDVINFDLANIFSASCMFPGLNFYQRLLVTTLAPIALFGVLVVTYQLAKRRTEIGTAGIVERRAAWSRHMAAGLLLTFLVSLNYPFAQESRFVRIPGDA